MDLPKTRITAIGGNGGRGGDAIGEGSIGGAVY